MKFVWRLLALGALLYLPFAAPASAQYMYMDTNGDGVHTSADVMSPNGTQTSADIYLITNKNRDGSTAVCDDNPATELTINSYVVNLLASGGAVNYSGFTNAIPSFTIVAQPLLSNTTEFTVGYASGTPLPPGKYMLGTVTLTGNSGSTSLGFAPMTSLGPNPNSFGTACAGTDFDNTYKLGLDWNNADGLGAAAGGNSSPVITAAASINATEGVAITPLTITATDADAADVLSITALNVPNGLTVISTPGTSPVTAVLTGMPSYDTQGNATITWSVSDGVNPPVTATTILTIANTDRAPVVTAPATVSGTVGTPISIAVTAEDRDAEPIVVLSAAPLPSGATFTTDAANTAGTLSWTPTAGQAGPYDIVFTATNGLSGTAATHIDVAAGGGTDHPPVLDAISNVTVAEGGNLTVNLHAADQDNDVVVLSATGLPSFATLNAPTSGTGSVSTTITLAPGTGTAGTYTVIVTATANGAVSTHTFVVTVTAAGVNVAPVVTAPANANGTVNAQLSFTVTAFDADGDAISSLTASPLPAGATFTANASNTLGTFTWTPTGTQAGSYDVTFSAMNELTGSAATHIIISDQGSTDRPPVVCAPSCWTGLELCTLSFRVTASDPDGDAIASLTASPLPTGATFTTNAAYTSGTFRWTPTITQSGDYTVTFTASNALTGSATTHVRVRDKDQTLTIAAIEDVTVAEGSTVVVNVSATDTDATDTIRLTACLPGFATLNAPLTAMGSIASTVTISPTVGSAGTYQAFVRARSGATACETERFTITVTPATGANVPPTITAQANVSVNEGALLTVNVSASDVNGDAVTLAASGLPTGAIFTSTGATGSITWTPTSLQSGAYTVTITADDGHGGTATANVHITVNDVAGGAAQALVFLTGNIAVIHPNEDLCLHVEPMNSSFAASNVNLSSITVSYGGHTVTASSSQVVDANGNSIDEVEACFTADQLATLFGDLVPGQTSVTLAVGGSLMTGGTLEGSLTKNVVAGAGLAKGHGVMNVIAKPNPLNPSTDLSFRISRAGSVRVDLFDASGRLVRTMMAQTLQAGRHSVPWNGTNDRGGHVASGAYFFRIQAPDGMQVQRVTVVK
ncbi:MAG TPA: putative Ig domain-containing protein [Candidatus Limnocylindrales bacterium]|nr:putative Ig domain-containing protein [Candidatus Limnocylindrales bacterium]